MKIRSVIIDAVTSIQESQYTASKKKPGHDKWFDYGKTILHFINELKRQRFEIILLVGEPGKGKTYSLRTLPTGSAVLYNADKRTPRWKGAKETFGTLSGPKDPFHILPDTYEDIISHIQGGINAGAFEEERFAIITGHTEIYKVGLENRERLFTLGQLTNKLKIESKLDLVFYSKAMKNEEGVIEYYFEIETDGYNTARSWVGLFESSRIPNDMQAVIEACLKY